MQLGCRAISSVSRFHNVSGTALADAIGHADAVLKGAEAEVKALKDEIERRDITEVAGDSFTITATKQIAGHLDTSAAQTYFGESWHRFEVATISTVIHPHQGRSTACRVA